MPAEKIKNKTYYELSEHNVVQISLFIIIFLLATAGSYFVFMPILQNFLETFLHGKVYNTGEVIPYYLEFKEPLSKTSYFFSWAVDLYVKSPQEARYWFNPFLSLFLQSIIFGVAISFILTSLLPRSLGLMRQKIERETATLINKIAAIRYGFHTDQEYEEIVDEILNADIKSLYNYVEEWNISFEDLKALYRALKWQNSGFMHRLVHINDGITMYMRFYFSIKYGNAVLGVVYIGAAFLIVIIGLRGLKFIPPTQPSLVLFALGLEFSLLIIYAFTLMYSKQEEELSADKTGSSSSAQILGSEFGSSKEIEKFLRVFIKSSNKPTQKTKK